MKNLKLFLFFFLVCGFNSNLLTQAEFKFDDTLRIVNFRITDANTKEPVGLAHIINITQRKGVISDLLGYLNIPIAIGDSLRVTAIGYKTKEFFSWGQYKSDTLFYGIELTPMVYEIKEVKVTRFSTYERFLREVVNLKIPKNKEDEQLERLQGYFYRVVKEMDLKNLPGITAGIGFGEDWYHKQNKKLEELLEKEKDRRIIDRKFNPGLVQTLTGLSGEELYKFMATLDFSNDFIQKSSDYEIQEKILAVFKKYSERKETSNTKTNP